MYSTREQWLLAAIEKLRPIFEGAELVIPRKLKVSCSFPGRGNRRKTIGECWKPVENDAFIHVLISPVLLDEATTDGVLETLTHELIHACLPHGSKHGKVFNQAMKKIGLEPPSRSTTAGPELVVFFQEIVKEIGPYPHRQVTLPERGSGKVQKCRMFKVACPQCDYVVRVARKHLEEKGAPICPVCKIPFEEDHDEENET